MEEKNKKKQIVKMTIFITSIFVIFMSVTYAFMGRILNGQKQVNLSAGVLDLVLEEEGSLTLSDAFPMADEVGMIQEDVFEFKLVNKTSNPTNYILKLSKIEAANELQPSDVKYYLTKEGVGEPALLSTLTDGVIDTGTIAANDTIDYTLRLWIDSSVTDDTRIAGKSLSYKLVVDASMIVANCPVVEETEPNKPQLTSGMIAVTYNATDKTWVKADTTNNDWYNYDNQMWANAVTVTESSRDTYMDAAPNTPISMDDINTMWVWIPRYSYTIMQPYGRSEQKCSELGEITIDSPSNCRKVEYPDELRAEALTYCQQLDSAITTESECVFAFATIGAPFTTFEEYIDEGISAGVFENTTRVETYPDNIATGLLEQPAGIDIRFIKTTEKDTGTGSCEYCAENWVTPEGFTFGTEEIPGFWMAKFETSGSFTNSCTNETCSNIDLTVKPNMSPLIGKSLSNFFFASRSIQNTANASKYGFDEIGIGTMDTHMLKNTEWGIVAYLSQSIYGKYGNSNYIGADKEVLPNDCKITGIGGDMNESSDTSCTTNTYETLIGQSASTTGNIYGVYDMSGGAVENVMANYNYYSGESEFCGLGESGEELITNCVELPESKYYDLYTTIVEKEAYKFGDATFETKYWYNDRDLDSDDILADVRSPWLARGGSYLSPTSVGVFQSHGVLGSAWMNNTFRLAVKP